MLSRINGIGHAYGLQQMLYVVEQRPAQRFMHAEH